MLRQLIAFVFIMAFALQTFSRAIIVFDYAVNTKSYARNCENKARPSMHCNGKCQMMKQLKQEERKDQQNPDRKAENKNEVIYLSVFTAPVVHINIVQEPKLYATLQCKEEINFPNAVFHPPAIA